MTARTFIKLRRIPKSLPTALRFNTLLSQVWRMETKIRESSHRSEINEILERLLDHASKKCCLSVIVVLEDVIGFCCSDLNDNEASNVFTNSIVVPLCRELDRIAPRTSQLHLNSNKLLKILETPGRPCNRVTRNTPATPPSLILSPFSLFYTGRAIKKYTCLYVNSENLKAHEYYSTSEI